MWSYMALIICCQFFSLESLEYNGTTIIHSFNGIVKLIQTSGHTLKNAKKSYSYPQHLIVAWHVLHTQILDFHEMDQRIWRLTTHTQWIGKRYTNEEVKGVWPVLNVGYWRIRPFQARVCAGVGDWSWFNIYLKGDWFKSWKRNFHFGLLVGME